jgi:putative ubiquitin-RnfH superfamily antitoxin RatB of RatAB toxin-antitoxin module
MTDAVSITVAYAAPGAEAIVPLTLPAGATVEQAVATSGLRERFALNHSTIGYAIHGQRADGDTPLADGDRIELTRPLIADAKQIRRTRAASNPLPKAPLSKKRQ